MDGFRMDMTPSPENRQRSGKWSPRRRLLVALVALGVAATTLATAIAVYPGSPGSSAQPKDAATGVPAASATASGGASPSASWPSPSSGGACQRAAGAAPVV